MFWIVVYRFLSFFLFLGTLIFLPLRKIFTGKSGGDLLAKAAIRLPEKLKLKLKKNNLKKRFWIHAVSFGEVKTIEPLINLLREEFDDCHIFLSTSTNTGFELASNLSASISNLTAFYCPIDFYPCVKRYFDAINPDIFFLAETELWFELLFQVRERNILCFLVNARLTERSSKNYKKIPILNNILKEALKSFTCVFAQTETDRQRFLQIGFNEEKIKVLGNLKFDGMKRANQEELNILKSDLNIKDESFVIVSGSTHEGEESLHLDVYKELLLKFPNIDLRLIIAPRHLERLKRVQEFCKENKISFTSTRQKNFAKGQVFLVDTMGELGKFYGLGDIALLGGTWAKVGGHNPFEPLAYGVPIIVGEYTYKIKDLVKSLSSSGHCICCNKKEELIAELSKRIETHKTGIKTTTEELSDLRVLPKILKMIKNSIQ